MKNPVNLAVCIVLSFITQVNAQVVKQEGYRISGTVQAIDSGTILMLAANGRDIVDSSSIVNGRFEMKGKIGLPERRVFNIVPGHWSFRAFIEDTSLTFNIDTAGAVHYGQGANKWALIQEIDERGSAVADVYEKFKKETNQQYYIALVSPLVIQLKAANGQPGIMSRISSEIDSIQILAYARQKMWIENFVRQHPGSVAGVYMFSEFYPFSADLSLGYLQSVLDEFSGPAKASIYYSKLVSVASKLKQIQPNSMAPDFTLPKKDKTKFTLSSTRGSYTVIDFWASWCAPCREAIPNWKRAYEKFHQKGFMMVSLSDDRSRSDWDKALAKEQMPWVQVIDEFPDKSEPARVASLYGVTSLPFYVLLDKEGKVILTSSSEGLPIKKIEEVFK